jgi:hypothetical protein
MGARLAWQVSLGEDEGMKAYMLLSRMFLHHLHTLASRHPPWWPFVARSCMLQNTGNVDMGGLGLSVGSWG